MITHSLMNTPKSDRGLDDLLALNGVVLVVDPVGNHWVKFVALKVAPSPHRPHGVSYSLTLHGAKGERLVGYDNAHAISVGTGPSRSARVAHDHCHRYGTTKPYIFSDAATLMQDFWNDVDAVLKLRGVTP